MKVVFLYYEPRKEADAQSVSASFLSSLLSLSNVLAICSCALKPTEVSEVGSGDSKKD